MRFWAVADGHPWQRLPVCEVERCMGWRDFAAFDVACVVVVRPIGVLHMLGQWARVVGVEPNAPGAR